MESLLPGGAKAIRKKKSVTAGHTETRFFNGFLMRARACGEISRGRNSNLFFHRFYIFEGKCIRWILLRPRGLGSLSLH